MKANLADLHAFVAVARAKGFREAARVQSTSASSLSEAVRRLETQLSVRLLHRTTRSVGLTEAGQGLLSRLTPALNEVEAALDVVNAYRERPIGTLRINVPGSAARTILPEIVIKFLAAYPEIRLEIMTNENFVDLQAEGCDAGIRYDERLEQDMIAVPIGPRIQRAAIAAAPAYLARHGTPSTPQDLLHHACLRGRFPSGTMIHWELTQGDQTVRISPEGPLLTTAGTGTDLSIDAAIAGVGLIQLFEQWLQPHLDTGKLVPVLQDWWPSFSGPFLYYPGRRLVPAPLRAFIDFIKTMPPSE